MAEEGVAAASQEVPRRRSRAWIWWTLGIVVVLTLLVASCMIPVLMLADDSPSGGSLDFATGDSIAVIRIDGVIAGTGAGVDGYITPDPAEITRMLSRMQSKVQAVADQGAMVEHYPAEGAETLIIVYGVTSRAASAAVRESQRRGKPASLLVLKTLWPVPATAIFSRTDGVVAWRSCRAQAAPDSESLEVDASHLGMGHHPVVLLTIADRLAQPEGAWRPFVPPGSWPWPLVPRVAP